MSRQAKYRTRFRLRVAVAVAHAAPAAAVVAAAKMTILRSKIIAIRIRLYDSGAAEIFLLSSA